jgi:p-hydroxybenzoate 3-monooxygenase
MKAQVGIIGAGPAGLFLAHLRHRGGIIIESRSQADVEGTIRAGVLEHWVVDLMQDLGLGERMLQQGHFSDGMTLQWDLSATTLTSKASPAAGASPSTPSTRC